MKNHQTNEIFGASRIAASLKKDIEVAKIVGNYQKEFKSSLKKMNDLFEIAKDNKDLLLPDEIEKFEKSVQILAEIEKKLTRRSIAKKFGI